jgi:hypothetical protein
MMTAMRLSAVTRSLALIAPLMVIPVSQVSAQDAPAQTPQSAIVCGSKAGDRQTCAADTSGGVTLVRTLGSAACDLGRTWGYDAAGVWVSEGCSAEFAVKAAAKTAPQYTPGQGFTFIDTPQGTVTFRAYGYVRYLSQRLTDPTYTNAFGQTRDVQQRQDIQLNKAQIYFFGWFMSPKLRYLTYVWTSNASLGQATQVVVAGNLTYRFNDQLTIGGGISGLPGTRSLEGSFPHWLMVDERQIADEYFRPSYTTGIWANGAIVPSLRYQVMLGNNLSQFGIDAGQLDNALNTVATSLVWMPTTGEFGTNGEIGDFDGHDRVATRFGVHLTSSRESRQSQPTTDAFDNVQLRVSDGSVIFAPNLFAPDTQIDEASYLMFAADAGVKYRGVSVDVEVYRRVLDEFRVIGTGSLPLTALHDTGVQVQASFMALPQQLQIYAGGSKIFGEYGEPSDIRAGVSWFPWKNRSIKWNAEVIGLSRSPVGALSLPYSVGTNGPVFHSSFMFWF